MMGPFQLLQLAQVLQITGALTLLPFDRSLVFHVNQHPVGIYIIYIIIIYLNIRKFFWPLEGDISRKNCRPDFRLTPKLVGFS